MTERLYYLDSYTRKFAARVLEPTTYRDQPALVLDQTYFYPTSGGQPSDRGGLNGLPVVEVAVRDSDKSIVHVLAQPLSATEVEGEIDWPRRFDHMQQHTGQHILSQAFLRAAEAVTIGFHLGIETVTIDLDLAQLTEPVIAQAEQIANEAVIANYPIRAWFPTPTELASLRLRKTPEVDGPLRVVAIGDFDYNACGGTHVAHTGEVGPIKILKVEKQKKGVRVEFICGGRALADYGRKHTLVSRLANTFTCGQAEVLDAVARLQAEAQTQHQELRAARERLLDHEAIQLLASAQTLGSCKVVRGAWAAREMAELRGLATRLTASPGVIALVGAAGEKSALVFARSTDVERDMSALFKSAIALLSGARGGGSAQLAQGGGVSAELTQVQQMLEFAQGELLK